MRYLLAFIFKRYYILLFVLLEVVSILLFVNDSYCNFYKCGDKQVEPHYLSWNPVLTDNPDFHRPEYFGKVIFEDMLE